jgi:predicted permease
VIGVADERATGPLPLRPDLWIPLTMQALTRPGEPLITNPTAGWLNVIGRRSSGVAEREAHAELTLLAHQALAVHSKALRATVTLAPGAFFNYPRIFESGVPVAAILFLAVTLVLLVACANVANMLLARGLARRREFAIRLSIGAGRWRLLRQLLTESLLLAVLGGAAGMAIAAGAGQALLAAMPADEFRGHQFDLSPDVTILLYTMGLSALTGVVFGLLPALNTLRVDLSPALKSLGLEGASRRRPAWLQNTLLGGQAAAGVVLLVCAGLLLRGFEKAMTFDTGLKLRDIVIGSFDLRQQQYSPEQAERIMTALRDRVAAVPGIQAASLTGFSPLISGSRNIAAVPAADGKLGRPFLFQSDEVGQDYFATYGIPLRRGRVFTPAELRGNRRLAVIDERLVRLHFGSADPLGRILRIGGENGEDHEIIGVVAGTQSLEPGVEALPGAYVPMRGLRFMEAKLIVRYSGPVAGAMKAIENAARELDPTITPRIVQIEENVAMALMPVRLAAAVAGTLGGIALLLACAGIYGVVSFAVNRRRREVGVRVALGAGRPAVLRLMLWQGLKPVLFGATLGVALAAAAAQLIRNLLYGLSALDPISFLGTGTVLAVAATFAALVPARAALSVDPAVTLRYE